MHLGKTLRNFRKDKTQAEVSKATKLTINYLSLLEGDRRGASLSTLEKLASVYGVKVWEIIKAAEEE